MVDVQRFGTEHALPVHFGLARLGLFVQLPRVPVLAVVGVVVLHVGAMERGGDTPGNVGRCSIVRQGDQGEFCKIVLVQQHRGVFRRAYNLPFRRRGPPGLPDRFLLWRSVCPCLFGGLALNPRVRRWVGGGVHLALVLFVGSAVISILFDGPLFREEVWIFFVETFGVCKDVIFQHPLLVGVDGLLAHRAFVVKRFCSAIGVNTPHLPKEVGLDSAEAVGMEVGVVVQHSVLIAVDWVVAHGTDVVEVHPPVVRIDPPHAVEARAEMKHCLQALLLCVVLALLLCVMRTLLRICVAEFLRFIFKVVDERRHVGGQRMNGRQNPRQLLLFPHGLWQLWLIHPLQDLELVLVL